MEISGYSTADLAQLLGSRPRALEVLNRRRALTMAMAHKLRGAWNIPADVLLAPYALRVTRKAPGERMRSEIGG